MKSKSIIGGPRKTNFAKENMYGEKKRAMVSAETPHWYENCSEVCLDASRGHFKHLLCKYLQLDSGAVPEFCRRGGDARLDRHDRLVIYIRDLHRFAPEVQARRTLNSGQAQFLSED